MVFYLNFHLGKSPIFLGIFLDKNIEISIKTNFSKKTTFFRPRFQKSINSLLPILGV